MESLSLHGRRCWALLAAVCIIGVVVGMWVGRAGSGSGDPRREEAGTPLSACELLAEIYQAAQDGPGSLDDRTFNDQVSLKIDQFIHSADLIGLTGIELELREAVVRRIPSRVRFAVPFVDCRKSTFPPVPAVTFDSTAVQGIEVGEATSDPPVVVSLPGVRMPSEEAVAPSMRAFDIRRLRDVGLPVGEFPLIDEDQARLAWVVNVANNDFRSSIIRFAADIDDSRAALDALVEAAAAMPEMVGAARSGAEGSWAALTTADQRVEIGVLIELDVLPGGVDVIEVRRTENAPGFVPLPPVMKALADYTKPLLTGSRAVLGGWRTRFGTDSESGEEVSQMFIDLSVKEPPEALMNAFAPRIGVYSELGTHLMDDTFIDPSQVWYHWEFNFWSDGTAVSVVDVRSPW
ncbi:MAG: hypothetical protein Q7V57_18375 [Actinomycetota bacterium]|nr:hypothetical protein [Actinomycetota bacterium]